MGGSSPIEPAAAPVRRNRLCFGQADRLNPEHVARPSIVLGNPKEDNMAETRNAQGAADPLTNAGRAASTSNPAGPHPLDQEMREPIQLDNELQADPQLAEGPASGRRIAVYAFAIVVIIGTVFYAMHTPSNPLIGSSSTVHSQSQPATRSASAMPGTTTGMTPAAPAAVNPAAAN
jgi:hypothetical protein